MLGRSPVPALLESVEGYRSHVTGHMWYGHMSGFTLNSGIAIGLRVIESQGKRTHILNELANYYLLLASCYLTYLISLWVKWVWFFLIPCEYWPLFPQGKVFYHLNSVYLGLTSEGQKVTGQVSQEPLGVARALWGVPSCYLPEPGV